MNHPLNVMINRIMRTRKDLPRLGYLSTMHVDVSVILDHLERSKLLDWEKYTDIKASANSKHRDFVVANEFCKDNFFLEEGAESKEGESYKQLYLTDFDEKCSSDKSKTDSASIFKRTRRLDPTKSDYLPEADELNYGIRNHLVTGPLEDVLNLFSSKITRVRLACLKSHFDIKPHVDYDPSYITRFHIPLITNTKSLIYVERKDDVIGLHLPADGRIYFLNSGLKHWVKNDGDADRLHLIVDVHGQDELDDLVTLTF